MDNWSFLVGAYTIAWLGVVSYLFINLKKQRVIEETIKDIESSMRTQDTD